MSNAKQVVRIGGGAGFWGDSAEGPVQLVESGEIDYLVLDYLAEITMSLLAKARAKDPAAGYATDFPDVIARLAPQLKAQKIKVVTNAGGVNPQACKAAIEEKLKALNIELKVSIVTGDDLLMRADEYRKNNVCEMFEGSALPEKLWSMNAYLGAFPIAAALDTGADIVVTGRCVDSAVALAPLIHEFKWSARDYNKLAAGSLVGHVIECGAQVTGGVSTDWQLVADGWHNMGFPIANCKADGSFVVSKPKGTGGRISPETVAEQIVYEIGDPTAYLLPDVSCDFSKVQLQQIAEDQVQVSGVSGYAPTASYKVSATYQDGFRSSGTMMIGGVDAVLKAEAVAAAILKRTRQLFAKNKMADYLRVDVEVLGAEANWGNNARRRDTREVILKIAVHHADKNALEIFGRECIPPATSMAQGITGFSGGRPRPTPLVRLFSCLVDKSTVPVQVDEKPFIAPTTEYKLVKNKTESQTDAVSIKFPDPYCTVPLIAIAYGRSGDKGDSANIGVFARKPEYFPIIQSQLTALAVKQYMQHFAKGKVERFELPGMNGFNFLLQNALGGGGMASLRYDPQGKMFAQILMDFEIKVPAAMCEKGGVLEDYKNKGTA